jgi:cytochrome P450
MDPFDPAWRDDPYPALNRLREAAPVHETPDGYFRIMRHADVTHVLKELKVGVRTTDGRLPGVDESTMPRRFMLMQDPPNHTRLRRLVSRAFTPPAIAAMQPHVQELVDDLLDAAEARGDGRIDVIDDLARPLPSTVICQMLGVPLEDRPKFTDWTAHITHLLAPRRMSDETRRRAGEAATGLVTYMSALIEERRKQLGDDMLSVLIRAEADGDKLSHEELITQSVGLLVAGFETTIGLVGNGMRQLMLHPEQLQKLRDDPALIDGAVEECLRFDGPIAATRRVLHEDAVIGGFMVPKDREVMLSIAASHRDPALYDRPDEFDITRDHKSHLAFGGGIHFCLGAHLARMETRTAIGKLVARFPKLELEQQQPIWGESLFRIQQTLPVQVA